MTSYHVFSLLPSLVDTLVPRNLATQVNLPENESKLQQQEPHDGPFLPSTNTTVSTGPRTCNICQGTSFPDVNEQRNHFRSDWHRYNVKLKSTQQKHTVSLVQFIQLVDALEDSISGSASSSSDEDELDTVAALISRTSRKKQTHSRPPSPSSTDARRSLLNTPLAWFHSPPSTQIGVYKAIFDPSPPNDLILEQLKELQECKKPEGRKWALFMVAGGHFAGAVVRVARPQLVDGEDQAKTKKGKLKKPQPDTEILLHKTFHRYTTRRKQGGSQSVNDNAKGNAHSSGAMLRRYGEQALRDDIQGILQTWADEIDQCERIWIRASVSNRRIFFDYDDAVIHKGDSRLRTFPFPTRRPTQSELGRCLLELTRVKMSFLTEDALRAQDEAYLASLPKPKPIPVPQLPKEKVAQPSVPKLSKEEEIILDKWQRVIEMISKGRLDTLKAFWEKEGAHLGGEAGINARVPEILSTAAGQTILQISSDAGQEEIVKWLLEEQRADPTIDVPLGSNFLTNEEPDAAAGETERTKRRTAYDIASSREVRNVFRRCAGAYPDWWDWLGAGRVPSILSQEMEEQRDEKKKVRRKGLKEKMKEREAKEKEEPKEEVQPVKEENLRQSTVGPRRLGGSAGDPGSMAGLTPEMKARVERERRARAAEARAGRHM